MSEWYYEHNGSAEGPISEDNIRRMIRDGIIKADTGLWRQEMDEWQPAASIRTFSDAFQQPPPLPESQSYSAPPPASDYASQGQSGSGSQSGSGGQSANYGGTPDIPSHMTKAILTTLCCCLPLGIVAIVKASNVSSAVRNGNYEEARTLSEEADTWANRSIVLGIVGGIIYFFISIAAGV